MTHTAALQLYTCGLAAFRLLARAPGTRHAIVTEPGYRNPASSPDPLNRAHRYATIWRKDQGGSRLTVSLGGDGRTRISYRRRYSAVRRDDREDPIEYLLTVDQRGAWLRVWNRHGERLCADRLVRPTALIGLMLRFHGAFQNDGPVVLRGIRFRPAPWGPPLRRAARPGELDEPLRAAAVRRAAACLAAAIAVSHPGTVSSLPQQQAPATAPSQAPVS